MGKWLASTLSVALIGGMLAVVGYNAQQAVADAFTPTVTIGNENGAENERKPFILAGEDSQYRVTVKNDSGDPKFNVGATALLPEGIVFESADFLGTPTVYTAGQQLPNNTRTSVPDSAECAPLEPVGSPSFLCQVPAGQQLWVWQNVADLPVNAEITSTLVVRPDTNVFPVGTDALEIDFTAYTSSNPTMLPTFDGSTSVATTDAHTSQPGTDQAATEVAALRVFKSEPSPESELLRGVHNNTTTYTIRVQNTGEASTDDVIVVDYLPAGLEYLGAGGIDNTENSPTLFDSNREYPNAPSLSVTPAPSPDTGDWSGTGETVETVELTAAQASALGLAGAGVYTKVTWNLGQLAGGSGQVFPSAEGVYGEYVIRYRAAVPLFENTMDWENPSSSEPGTTGEQTANLNNNNGSSTRHGIDDSAYNHAQVMKNAVAANGEYTGTRAPNTDAAVTDSDTEVIDAVDLRVLKSVSEDAFTTGAIANYTLKIATSEYTSADGITLTDHIANGLCPAFPSQTPLPDFTVNGVNTGQVDWNTTVGTDCVYPSSETGAAVSNGTVSSIDYNTATGKFVVEFATDALGANDTRDITYTVFQRSAYTQSPTEDGATSSGDVMVNTVDIRGTTTAIADLAGVTGSSGAEAFGDETVLDDSRAEIETNFSGLTKKVLERGKTPSTPSVAADWVDEANEPFALGDTVWYRLRVDFASDIEIRNPVLSDYLPVGVEFVEASYSYSLTGVGQATDTTTPNADYIGSPTIDVIDPGSELIRWQLGKESFPPSTARFIPADSWIEITIQGRVIGQSASASEVDRPQNQAKYQQENVEGKVFFLRADAAIDLDHGATLVKGVADIDGEPSPEYGFGSNEDDKQVVQGDAVTYRIDVTAPNTDTDDVAIWDALPPGITSTDIVPGTFTAALINKQGTAALTQTPLASGTQYTATVVDPTDAAYPSGLNSAYAGRSLILWTVTETMPGSVPADPDDPEVEVVNGLTLGYTVIVPDDAQITQQYVNYASIVSYDVQNNGGGESTLVPDPTSGETLSTSPAGPTDFTVDPANTADPSNIFVSNASVVKDRVSTEIAPTGTTVTDPHNGDGEIVQGEYVTFRYSVTIPAHTSVQDGVLADDGKFRWTGSPIPPTPGEVDYEFVSASVTTPTFLTPIEWGQFTFAAGSGTLTFPTLYQNDTDDHQTFTVEITVYVDDADASNPTQIPNFPDGKTLTNTARFGFTNPNDPTGPKANVSGTANVIYIEPNLNITKSANPSGEVSGNTPVEYTLTVSNTGDRPKTYDNVVVDTIPAGLIVDDTSFNLPPTSIDPGVTGGTGGTITWNIAEILETVQLTYTATIDPLSAGAQQYTNEVEVTGYTLPSTLPDAANRRGDRDSSADATITAIGAALDKGVRLAANTTGTFGSSVEAPVGDTVEYSVEVTLNPYVNYYDPVIVDTLPAGVELVEVTSGPTLAPDVQAGGSWGAPSVSGNTVTWTYNGDILAHSAPRTLTLTYKVLIDGDQPGGVAATVNALENTAAFSWNKTNDSTDPDDRADTEDTATVNILNPELDIEKEVSNPTPNPGEEFTYTVTVENEGNTPAHNIVIEDVVPTGVVVQPSTIDPAGTLAGNDAVTGGGTITWNLSGPLSHLAPNNTITLTYKATLAPSSTILDGDDFTNTASVTRYESFGDNGRVYEPTDVDDTATVTPPFPHVELAKTVTNGSVAYANQPFGWTLTLKSTGTGPAQTIAVTDVLPKNWQYDMGSAQISRGGVAAVALPNPSVATSGEVQTLNWSASVISSTTPALPAASADPNDATRTIVITFTATPQTAALTDAGVTTDAGLAAPHTNTLNAVTTDTSGATGNGSGSYTGPEADADGFIHSADLHLDKNAIGGTTAGLWIPGQAVGPDYTQPQWQIVITNQGPNDGYGPFRVVDTMNLPTGVTTGIFTARYYSGPTDTTGTALPPFLGSGTTASPYIVGDNATSLKADGSDRIVLVADVAIADTATGTATNTASVTGRTYEPDTKLGDNQDVAGKTLTPQADLTVTKSVNTTAPNAGASITWQIVPENLGPSVSVSTLSTPITLTDTVPAGISNVGNPSTSLWTASTPGGWPASGGDVITWTYTGTTLAIGTTAPIELTGTIASGWTQGTELKNLVEIIPGETPDPVSGNNDSEVPVTPTTNTAIDVTKTRVVKVGSDWVAATSLSPVPPFVPGDPVNYLVTVTNTGTANARNVEVVDEVPNDLTYDAHENQGSAVWTRTAGASPNYWDTFSLTGDLLPGSANAKSFVVTYDTDSSITAPVENWVEASADNAPSDRDSDGSDSVRNANLSVKKEHPSTPGYVIAGESLEYTITVENEGPSDSSGPIVVTDTLPAGFSYVAGSAQVTVAGGPTQQINPTISGQVLTWTPVDASGILADGDEIEITLDVDVAPNVDAQTGLENVAVVDGPDDNDSSDNTAKDPTEVRTQADMTIVKEVENGPWIAGTEVEYTLTVTNDGPSAVEARVADVLPAGLSLVSLSGSGDWSCVVSTSSCVYPNHPVGVSNASTITVTALISSSVATGTNLDNTADLTWSDSRGPHHEDDNAQITVTTLADLGITKSVVDKDGKASSATVSAGTQAYFLLKVHNYGPSNAVGPLTVVDTLPVGTSFVGIVNGGSWSAEVTAVDSGTGQQTVTFTRQPANTGVAAKTDAPGIHIRVDVDPAISVDTATNTASLTNTAVVSSGTPEPTPDPHSNTDTAELTVDRQVNLAVVKTHDTRTVRIGDELDFDLAVTNQGPSVATGVVVVDQLPAGLEYVDAAGSDAAWEVTAAPVAADGTTEITAVFGGELVPGATAPQLQITTLVNVEAYPSVVNLADVVSIEPDTDLSDNSDTNSVSVPALAKLIVGKRVKGELQVGQQATYIITLRNDGPTEDPGPITVIDQLPADLEFVSSPDKGVTVNGRTVTWVLEDGLAVGEKVTLTVNVKVLRGSNITNTVSVETPTDQLAGKTLTDTAAADVKSSALIAQTGADSAGWLPILLMLGGGAVLLVVSRRQRSQYQS